MTQSVDWKIVLIDDEEDIRQVISIVLADEGYNTTTAPDGETGIRLCKELAPQIVITDIRMPGMDGIQVLETLKVQQPDTEVIVITAFGEMDMASEAMKLDASDFITKPVNQEVLLLAVKRAQNRYISKKQLQELIASPNNKEINHLDPMINHPSFHRDLIESAMDGALICDENESISALNKSMAQILGYSESEVIHKMHLNRFFSLKEKERFDMELRDEQYGGKDRLSLYEANLLDRSGSRIPVQISATALINKGQRNGIICFFKDLRGKKILSDQWMQLVDQLNIGAFTIDLDRRITSFNNSAQTITGLKESEVLGKDCREVFSDVPCYAKCPSHVGGNHDTDDLSVEITDQSDVRHLVTRLTTPLYGPGNKVAGCLTLLQDHAALADLISRLNYEERSLKVILDNLDIGIFTVNRGGHITFFNSAAEIISGFTRRQVLGRPCSVIFGNGESKDPTLLKEAMNLGASRTNDESAIITQDGETIPIRADYIPLHSDQGKIVGGLATIQDLTLAHQFNEVVSNRYTFHSMIGKEPVMQKIFQTVEVVAKSNATILIEGATGTGKDLLAGIIHSTSHRADKPLVKVNCAALPDNLLESELFGYVKGAFTGADKNKTGRFQEADKGTIFLDEIGDLPLALQAKLLRVLEDQEFYPLGGQQTIKVDVRIISATNRGLIELVSKRQFREDLFYRLNVVQIPLPPLKERKADLPLLIRHIIRKLCTAGGNRSCQVSRTALQILLNYDYPGNVRELQNILEHALIICRDNMIEPEHLPLSMQSSIANNGKKPSEPISEGIIPENEREKILQVLKEHNWHRNNAANALGMDRTTLWRKMKSFGITPP